MKGGMGGMGTKAKNLKPVNLLGRRGDVRLCEIKHKKILFKCDKIKYLNAIYSII